MGARAIGDRCTVRGDWWPTVAGLAENLVGRVAGVEGTISPAPRRVHRAVGIGISGVSGVYKKGFTPRWRGSHEFGTNWSHSRYVHPTVAGIPRKNVYNCRQSSSSPHGGGDPTAR